MRLYALLVAFVLFAASTFAVEKPSTIADTLALMAEALRASDNVASLEIDKVENSLEVTGMDGNTILLFAGNLHLLLRSLETAQEREEALSGHITGALLSLERGNQSFTRDDLGKVFPIVRNRNFEIELGFELIAIPFAGELAVFYVQDLGSTVNYLTVKGIAKAGVSKKEIEAAATRNVDQLLPELTVDGQEVYFLVLDGFYETSFLMMEDYWTSASQQLGPIAMIVPNRDLVVFAPADDAQLVQFLRNTAKTYSNELPWPVSDQVFYWKDEGPWSTKP
ncbi:MAG: DUF1444 family protein [Alphaproteobacteria bacterium]|nr:DUF1444 family protein [Alphaproteobacteria bacterium]